MPQKIICVVGTRPEVIKMAPVIKALRKAGFEAPILATAQHRGLLDQMLATFDLKPDWDLDVMKPNQELAQLTGVLVPRLHQLLKENPPLAVLSQGDTTTVFCAALAAFYAGVPFGHVEAGLRSGDLSAPFPEEGMRRLSSVITRWHFAPTEASAQALRTESYADDSIFVVGNTVIDALLDVASSPNLPWPVNVPVLKPNERLILITLHRRENFGGPLERILTALKDFSLRHPEARMVYPVHPNPNVSGPAHRILGDLPNISLVEPLDYPVLVRLMKEAYLVLTDSGGIQEEAPALGKPVLVFRDVTERPEAVDAGGVRLVGSDPELFMELAERLWVDPITYHSMAKPRFPYGDGKAAQRIAEILLNTTSFKPASSPETR
jgi:UDP-N-acetylglucosamine 2-epimerase (non-hydrolysing)